MPTYIMLTSLTAQGVQTLKANPDRVREVNRDVEELGGAGLLLGNPPESGIDVEPLVAEALAQAAEQGVSGKALTPFVLSRLHEQSGGRTLEVNRDLIVANAALAARVAVAATP